MGSQCESGGTVYSGALKAPGESHVGSSPTSYTMETIKTDVVTKGCRSSHLPSRSLLKPSLAQLVDARNSKLLQLQVRVLHDGQAYDKM